MSYQSLDKCNRPSVVDTLYTLDRKTTLEADLWWLHNYSVTLMLLWRHRDAYFSEIITQTTTYNHYIYSQRITRVISHVHLHVSCGYLRVFWILGIHSVVCHTSLSRKVNKSSIKKVIDAMVVTSRKLFIDRVESINRM